MPSRHFKDFDFEKLWDEFEWERYLQAEDRRKDEMMAEFEREMERAEELASDPLSFSNVCSELGIASRDEETDDLDLPKVASNPSRLYWEDGASMHLVPIYDPAFQFGCSLLDFVNKARTEIADIDAFVLHGLRIGADIAGGHGLGYEKRTIYGNIAKLKRAHEHVRAVSSELWNLRQSSKVGLDAAKLFVQASRLETDIADWIEELRERFGWS